MKMEFDMTDFNWTMKKYLSVNRRENAELINKKASQFTAVAVNRTIVAGGSKNGSKTVAQGARNVIRELRQPRNDGNDKGHRRWKNLGEAIIQQARFKKTGKYYSDAQLASQFNALVRARTAKIGFLKSGWFPETNMFPRISLIALWRKRDARRRRLAFTLKEKTKEARQLRRRFGQWRQLQTASMWARNTSQTRQDQLWSMCGGICCSISPKRNSKLSKISGVNKLWRIN
jgi:hypothetical protein